MQGYRSNLVRLWAGVAVIVILTAAVALAAERSSSSPIPEAGSPTTVEVNPSSTSPAPSALATSPTTTGAPPSTLATDATMLIREGGPFGTPPVAEAPPPDAAPETVGPETAPEPATTTTVAPSTTVAPPTTAAPAPSTTTTLPPTTTTTAAAPASGSYSADAEAQFLSSINGVRSGVGLGGLSSNSSLKDYARNWARHMAETGSFAHSNIASLLGTWSTVGENLGRGTSGVTAIFNALVNSPAHYDNMTNGSFTHVGVGVFVDASGEIWTAHVFGG